MSGDGLGFMRPAQVVGDLFREGAGVREHNARSVRRHDLTDSSEQTTIGQTSVRSLIGLDE